MKKYGPWIVKGNEIKYKNPWIEVREDQVIRPNGQDGIYGVVTMVPGVAVLALDTEGYVHLTDEFKYAHGQDSLEVVNGAVESGESPLKAAQRELKEEAGIEAQEWTDLGTTDPFTSVVHSPAQMFLAQELTFVENDLDDTETLKIRKVSFKDAVQMVINSEITHGPSCLVILKAHLLLNSAGV